MILIAAYMSFATKKVPGSLNEANNNLHGKFSLYIYIYIYISTHPYTFYIYTYMYIQELLRRYLPLLMCSDLNALI
jgi:hypothetical protein